MMDPKEKPETSESERKETDAERRERLYGGGTPFGKAPGGGMYNPTGGNTIFGGQSQDDETDSDKETDEHAD